MHICSFLIPEAKTTELVQLREGTFYDPAPSSQTAAVFRIGHCEQRRDVTCTQSTADFLCVVGPISQYAIGTTARPTRRPCSGGMASSSGNAWVESWQFAPVSSIANGMPRPSQIRLARSVGFAPVCGPQKLLAPNNYQQPHGTSRSGHYEKANSATRSESGPKFRHAANRVNAANKSFQNRNPIVSAASARECHFGVRTEYL